MSISSREIALDESEPDLGIAMDSHLPTHHDRRASYGPQRASGYPELAFLISTDMDFSVFRKFDELSARNLLRMQGELMSIDEELRSMDNSETGYEHIMDRARKESLFSRLEVLMEKYRIFDPKQWY